MDIMELKLNDIIIDENLNVRESLDDETVERYMGCFDQLPAVVAFNTDDGYLLADGFHRVEAAKKLEREEIEVNVMKGTRQDAEEYAALANLQHGKPLTRAERRKAVERMLMLHTERSDRWIAEDMGVSKNTVAKYREELEAGGQIDQVEKFIGKDGKEYPREIPHPKKDEQLPEEQKQPQETAPTAVEECSQATEVEATEEEQTQAEAPTPSVEAVQVVEPQAEDTVEAQAEEIQLHCDEQFCSLDDIKEYIGTPVEVVISAGRRAANVAKHGVILDVVEQEGKFVLDFENENGEKQQIPTGTTTGEATDIGILEIRIVEPQETISDEPVDEVEQEVSVEIAEISVTDNPLKESPETRELSFTDMAMGVHETETEPQDDDTIDEDEDYADEKVDANLPANFWANWNGLMANYQKLVDTCEIKDIAQEFLNTPEAKRHMANLRGFLDTISSLMKSLSSSDW